MKIVFLDSATIGADVSLAPISQLGELLSYPSSTPQEALSRVKDCEVLIINKVMVNKALIDAAPNLRLICEAATGVNNIDVEYAKSKNIAVRNVAGYSTDSVVQLTYMHILNLICHSAHFDNYVKSGEYSRSGVFTEVSTAFTELSGKCMGVIGMGTIGYKVAKIALAFGMNVIYYSTSGTSHCSDFPSVSISELMKKADVISVNAPLNARTKGLIGENELAMMKPSAVIVNLGRGGIIDEKALSLALDAGTIAGAAADVFTSEPLPADNPLLQVKHPERLSLSPHIAWASREARERLIAGIAANISNFLYEA